MRWLVTDDWQAVAAEFQAIAGQPVFTAAHVRVIGGLTYVPVYPGLPGYESAIEALPSEDTGLWVLVNGDSPLLFPAAMLPQYILPDTAEVAFTDTPGLLLLQLLDRYKGELDRAALVEFGQSVGILPGTNTLWDTRIEDGRFTPVVPAQGPAHPGPASFRVTHVGDLAMCYPGVDATEIENHYRLKPWMNSPG